MQPRYKHWKTRNQGYADYQGSRVYFRGDHGSPESLSHYAEWLATLAPDDAPSPPETITALEIAVLYLEHCERRFGRSSSTFRNHRRAVRRVLDAGWKLRPAADFGPKSLKRIQASLATEGIQKSGIAKITACIRQWYRWAASEELITVATWQSLLSVAGYEGPASEPSPRQPVAWDDVHKTLAHLPPVLRAMVLLQWHTGARSGSVVAAQPPQFAREGDLVIWRPRHKMERRQDLAIPLGPQAQAAIGNALEQSPYCFISPHTGRPFTPQNYLRRIKRAQAKAEVKPFCMHQMRHAKGHAIREKYGIEAAQAILGHTSLQTTEIYSEKRLELAKKIALETG